MAANCDIIPEKAKLLVGKYGATPYFSTAKLIFKRKTGPGRYIKEIYQPLLLV